MKVAVLWVVALCTLTPIYTVLQLRRQPSSKRTKLVLAECENPDTENNGRDGLGQQCQLGKQQ
jgi:hypothetical protein